MEKLRNKDLVVGEEVMCINSFLIGQGVGMREIIRLERSRSGVTGHDIIVTRQTDNYRQISFWTSDFRKLTPEELDALETPDVRGS